MKDSATSGRGDPSARHLLDLYEADLRCYLEGHGPTIDVIQREAADAARRGVPVSDLASVHHACISDLLERPGISSSHISALARVACAACPAWLESEDTMPTPDVDRQSTPLAGVDRLFPTVPCALHTRVGFAVISELREQESRRLARALHDRAGQLLTSAHLIASDLFEGAPEHLAQKLEELHRVLHEIETELRDLSHELRPRVLDDFGLSAALGELARTFTRRTGVEVIVDASLSSRLAGSVETAMYRVAEEALTNVRKHAQATRVIVHLRHLGDRVELRVQDNGIGFEGGGPNAASRGLGLIGISERAAALGGRALFTSRTGGGTEIVLSAPVKNLSEGPTRRS